MENAKYIALSRQTALWRRMDAIANNLANMNTAGFKREDQMFTEYLVKSPAEDKIGKEKIRFVQDLGTYRDFAEGALTQTGNNLDVAIHGDAFFAIETPQGEKYTRKGQFSLDSEGKLVTASGNAVLSDGNDPFFFAPNESQIEISTDGTISTENGVIGKLKVVSFDDNLKLKNTYDGLYETTYDNQPQDATNVSFAQGMIEQSNVNPILEMTNMIDVQRSYANVQKLIDIEYERQKEAINVFTTKV